MTGWRERGRATGRAPSTIGRLASGDGRTYARLRAGADITTRRAARIVQWLSNHWPADAEWTSDIPRPPPAPGSPAAAPPDPEPAPPADPVAAVQAAEERMMAAMFGGAGGMDLPAAQAAEEEKLALRREASLGDQDGAWKLSLTSCECAAMMY